MEILFKQSANLIAQPKLSICIATYNRGKFISETLDSILSQMPPDVELVVVDGASPDNTSEVMAEYMLNHPEIRYFRENTNSGVDRDYDKAVIYSKGNYCWLMTDDDLLSAGAVARVLDAINEAHDLIIVNSAIKNADFSKTLDKSFLKFADDKIYTNIDKEKIFSEAANYLSFIGGVIIRRSLWLERDRAAYFGTLFIHVGVIFQHPPITKVKVIAEPLISIRYGNAMWTARGFEIWMFKWPQLIWSFVDFTDQAKASVCLMEPWRKVKKIILYRAIGGYGLTEYQSFLAARTKGLASVIYKLIALVPAKVVNLFAGLYCVFVNRNARSGLYDISRSKHATWVTRWLERFL